MISYIFFALIILWYVAKTANELKKSNKTSEENIDVRMVGKSVPKFIENELEKRSD